MDYARYGSLALCLLLIATSFANDEEVGVAPTDEEVIQWIFDNCSAFTGVDPRKQASIPLRSPGEGLAAISFLSVNGIAPPSMDYLSHLPNVEKLYIEDVRIGSIKFLESLPKLRILSFLNVSGIQDSICLKSLVGLEELSIVASSHHKTWSDYYPEKLKSLALINLDLTKAHNLDKIRTLEELYIRNCSGVNPSIFQGMTNLEVLELNQVWNSEAYPGAGFATGNSTVHDYSVIGNLTELKHLDLRGLGGMLDVEFLRGLTNIVMLEISGCPKVTDICPAAELAKLKRLYLKGSDKIINLRCLSGLTELETLLTPQNQFVRDIPAFFDGLSE